MSSCFVWGPRGERVRILRSRSGAISELRPGDVRAWLEERPQGPRPARVPIL